MTQTGVWLKPNETQMNSNFECTNFSRFGFFKIAIHLKVNIKKGTEELHCVLSQNLVTPFTC